MLLLLNIRHYLLSHPSNVKLIVSFIDYTRLYPLFDLSDCVPLFLFCRVTLFTKGFLPSPPPSNKSLKRKKRVGVKVVRGETSSKVHFLNRVWLSPLSIIFFISSLDISPHSEENFTPQLVLGDQEDGVDSALDFGQSWDLGDSQNDNREALNSILTYFSENPISHILGESDIFAVFSWLENRWLGDEQLEDEEDTLEDSSERRFASYWSDEEVELSLDFTSEGSSYPATSRFAPFAPSDLRRKLQRGGGDSARGDFEFGISKGGLKHHPLFVSHASGLILEGSDYDSLGENQPLPLWGSFALNTSFIFQWQSFAEEEDQSADGRLPFSFPSLLGGLDSDGDEMQKVHFFSQILLETGVSSLITPSLSPSPIPPSPNAAIGGLYESEEVDLQEEHWSDEDLSIVRVRFKPGYSRIWRKARKEFSELHGLKFRYQAPLTRHFLRLRKFSLIARSTPLLMQVGSILNLSQLFWSKSSSLEAVRAGIVYVNGLTTRNPSFSLFGGDIIQVLISMQYYVSFFTARLQWQRHAWQEREVSRIFLKRRERRKLVSDHNLGSDIPHFLEVDFFSLSCFVLSSFDLEPFAHEEGGFHTSVPYMYNWKYVN